MRHLVLIITNYSTASTHLCCRCTTGSAPNNYLIITMQIMFSVSYLDMFLSTESCAEIFFAKLSDDSQSSFSSYMLIKMQKIWQTLDLDLDQIYPSFSSTVDLFHTPQGLITSKDILTEKFKFKNSSLDGFISKQFLVTNRGRGFLSSRMI